MMTFNPRKFHEVKTRLVHYRAELAIKFKKLAYTMLLLSMSSKYPACTPSSIVEMATLNLSSLWCTKKYWPGLLKRSKGQPLFFCTSPTDERSDYRSTRSRAENWFYLVISGLFYFFRMWLLKYFFKQKRFVSADRHNCRSYLAKI